MRTIAIGDVHGCSIALQTLLKQISPKKSDTLVFLGDYVDRGPDTKGVIQQIIDLSDVCNMITLMGNHELMFMQAYGGKDDMNTWLRYGGLNTLTSYGFTRTIGPISGDDLKDVIPREHIAFVVDCQGHHETDDHIFVHAGYDWDAPMDKQTENASFWNHLKESDPPRPHISGKTFFVGHTAQKSCEVLDLSHIVCIDTWVNGPGWLTAMDVDTREVWQANQQGKSVNKMVCFVHNTKLLRVSTRHGNLWVCPTSKCDVKCWEGPTSYPGTQEDFDERKATHKLFDKVWRDEKGIFSTPLSSGKPPSHGKRRGRAYKWLSKSLQIEQKDAHIGMLRADDCRKVQEGLALMLAALDAAIEGAIEIDELLHRQQRD